MLINYLVIALRNLQKYKIFSALNIFDLALGISCVVFIYSYIKYELSFDKCYPKSDRIYRVINISTEDATTRNWAPTSPPLGPELKNYMPEIESYCRFYQIGNVTISINDSIKLVKKFTEYNGFFADPSALQMFDLELLSGNPETALNELQVIVISESMAERFFPGEDALGKTIHIDNYNADYLVTGVMKNVIGNTHLKLNFLIPMERFRQYLIAAGREGLFNSKGWAGPYNYILLKGHVKVKDVVDKMPDFTVKYLEGNGTPEEILARTKFNFQPIEKIHLYSNLEQEIGPNSDITYVYVFLTVAILILLIGGVNYVNISTAQSMRRVKEIGVRKVIGANRGQIIRQYFGESLLITLLAGILAVLLIDLLYPSFNKLSGLNYSLPQFFSNENIVVMLIIIFGMGILAGIYPAILASGFSIEDNFKGARKVGSFSQQLRKILIVLQFAISVFLIFSTLSIFKQLKLFNDIDLGFTKENVFSVDCGPDLARAIRKDYKAYKANVLSNTRILNVSSCSNLPGERTSVESLTIKGFTPASGNMPSMRFVRADDDYLKTMKIDLLDGENFQYNADTIIQFLINESCKIAIGIENPIGSYATNIWGVKGRIVGIMKDFNFASLHEGIEPMVIEYTPPGLSGNLFFRYTGDSKEALEYVEGKLKEYDPTLIFSYTFIIDQWDSLYTTEIKAGDTFRAFTFLAIIISCIGLFGLAAFTSESRTKEMGIRKIHGAGFFDILKAFGASFLKLILVASIIAIPAAWIIIERWLQEFEYQIKLSWLFVVYSLIIILLISFLTILYQVIKVYHANPIDHIRTE